MEFPKDEVKNKVVWTKGADFTDGSPRYTFEGRDPATTYERFQVVIYTEMERRYAHDPGSLCNHYYGYVRDDKMECAETIGPYYSVREAKQKTLELFNSFVQQYAAQELDSTTPESADYGQDDQQEHFQYQWAGGTPQRKYADMLDNVYFDSDGEAGKFTTNIFAYPTTYVVDRSGNIVGEPIVGAITEKKQAETLQKLIDQALAADMG